MVGYSASPLKWTHTWTFTQRNGRTGSKSVRKAQRDSNLPQGLPEGQEGTLLWQVPRGPVPCICPSGPPAAAGSRASPGTPSHISSASWSVPAGSEEKPVRPGGDSGKHFLRCFLSKYLAFWWGSPNSKLGGKDLASREGVDCELSLSESPRVARRPGSGSGGHTRSSLL